MNLKIGGKTLERAYLPFFVTIQLLKIAKTIYEDANLCR